MKKFFSTWPVLIALALIAGVLIGGITAPAPVDAALDNTKHVVFSGYGYTGKLGNTTGAFGATYLERGHIPDSMNCFFFVTNATTNTIVANTATANLETSPDNLNWDIFKTVTVAASVVTGIYNVPLAGLPFGEYWRVNITAIQNANSSYVRSECYGQ